MNIWSRFTFISAVPVISINGLGFADWGKDAGA